MIELLYDCDLTMGIPGKDVDDGLALLYLLGRQDVRLHGITSTFGNSTLEQVHGCLERTMRDWGLSGVPLYRGASSPAEGDSPAARFLASTVQENPGRFSLLATGSLTNLLDAARLDPDFLAGFRQIVVMGGITEPLLLNGRIIPELNFSTDPPAASEVLGSAARLTVISGNLCLPLLLERHRFESLLRGLRVASLGTMAGYLGEKVLPSRPGMAAPRFA